MPNSLTKAIQIIRPKLKITLIVLLLLVAAAGYVYQTKKSPQSFLHLKNEKDPAILFLSEAYDKIKENYWEKINDQDLTRLFKLASDKVSQQPGVLKANTKEGMLSMVKTTMKNMDGQKKKEFATNVTGVVLGSLKPFGRSALYTTKQEVQLQNLVQNVNPEKDLYKDLGLEKNASEDAVKKAYTQKEAKLKSDQSEEAKKQLMLAKYAKDVLVNQDTKKNYDNGGIEPTVFTKLITPRIFYIQLKKFSPTTFDEFQKAANTYADASSNPDVLIFDLRSNIGGAIDATSYFLGNFLGYNQYAYDFYQQGKFEPFKTQAEKLPGLAKFKQVVILVDNQTQSSAELMASSLKKYHYGVVLGTTTKGWGTIERVFSVEHQIDESEKYSLFLVHHITIRDDGQPIEGRGVDPNINIKDSDWENQLYSYFRNPELTQAVRTILNTNPNQ